MSRTSALILSLLLVSPPGALPRSTPQSVIPPREEEVMRQILELEAQSKEAALRNDAPFIERTLAEDYVAIGPLGNVITKSDSVAVRRQGKLHYDSMDIGEMVVRVYGETAIVTARAVVKGSNLGEDFSGPYRFTRVWVKRNGQWQTASYQATVTQ